MRATSTGVEGNYQVATAVARINAMIWDLYKNAYKYSIVEFNDFVGNHWGKTDFSRGDLLDTNLPMAAGIGSVYEEMIQFAEDAKKANTRKINLNSSITRTTSRRYTKSPLKNFLVVLVFKVGEIRLANLGRLVSREAGEAR